MELDFPSLQDLAAEVAYKEVLSNLMLCHEHRPQGKQLNWLPYSSLLRLMNPSGLLQSEHVRDFVRRRLNLGILGNKIRKDFVKKFYESVQKSEEEAFGLVDIWVFLDCLLNSNFEELKTHVAYPGSGPSPKLIPTIVERSPLLKKLSLDFRLMKAETEFEELKAVIRSLELLKNLTNLELVLPKLDDNQQATLLNLVGKSCPLLSRLEVSGQNLFKDEDVLALFIGNLMMELNETERPQNSAKLERLKLPVTSLTPVCYTLKEFKVMSTAEFSYAAAAFVLRHVPLLEELHIYNLAIGYAVKLLYELEQQNHDNATGKLALTTLNCLDVSDATMLRAVGALCPYLKAGNFEDIDGREVSSIELQSIFNEWSKLTKIRLADIHSTQYVRSILKAFGQELIDLEFAWDCEFNMRDLCFCTKLESLDIGENIALLDLDQMDISLDTATFLPELKVLKSSIICLGSWSSLLETKSNFLLKF